MSAATVYRAYDENDTLLYVGMTTNWTLRQRAHRKTAPWWAAMTVVDLEEFPTATDALDAEGDAIREESPRFNRTTKRISADETLRGWGRAIRAHRRSLGIVQATLGAMLSPPVNQSSVNRWEHGLIEPSRDNKVELARIFGVDANVLFAIEATS